MRVQLSCRSPVTSHIQKEVLGLEGTPVAMYIKARRSCRTWRLGNSWWQGAVEMLFSKKPARPSIRFGCPFGRDCICIRTTRLKWTLLRTLPHPTNAGRWTRAAKARGHRAELQGRRSRIRTTRGAHTNMADRWWIRADSAHTHHPLGSRKSMILNGKPVLLARARTQEASARTPPVARILSDSRPPTLPPCISMQRPTKHGWGQSAFTHKQTNKPKKKEIYHPLRLPLIRADSP
jgi:hypothetical protein